MKLFVSRIMNRRIVHIGSCLGYEFCLEKVFWYMERAPPLTTNYACLPQFIPSFPPSLLFGFESPEYVNVCRN